MISNKKESRKVLSRIFREILEECRVAFLMDENFPSTSKDEAWLTDKLAELNLIRRELVATGANRRRYQFEFILSSYYGAFLREED